MKSKKELLLSAGLILTATLGLTGCSTTESVTPAPETNTGEKVEVETQKPSTDENTTDSTVTPEPEVEVQKPTPEVETNSCTTENTEKKHPFGEIKSSQSAYQDWSGGGDGYVVRYMNIGKVEFNSTDFTKEDFLAFYEQEVKGSDYDRVEIRLSDDLGIIFLGTKGVFGFHELFNADATSEVGYIPAYANGFIQKDGTILYSEELFEESQIETLNENLSIYQIIDSFTEYGLFLYVNPIFITNSTNPEIQIKLIKDAIATIISELKEIPTYTTLQGLHIYFSGSRNDYDPVASLNIDLETLMTTDWGAFARGEFFLDEDQFSIELSNLNKPKG